jgi:hypothetical protein
MGEYHACVLASELAAVEEELRDWKEQYIAALGSKVPKGWALVPEDAAKALIEMEAPETPRMP